ncbi:MAG: hypothetical protein R6W71_08215 [Bacteroidales bacterium]
MLKKDNIAFGILIGIALPAMLFGLLMLITFIAGSNTTWSRHMESSRMMILSVFINLVPIRIYFVNWKLDKTGRGVLLVTFILMVIYFASIRYI